MTVRVRLPDCCSPAVGLLGSGSRTTGSRTSPSPGLLGSGSRTAEVRLSDCWGPPAGLLGSASRTAAVRLSDYRRFDCSPARTSRGIARRSPGRGGLGSASGAPSLRRHVRFADEQPIVGRPAPPARDSGNSVRGLELLQGRCNGAARECGHHREVGKRRKAVSGLIRGLSGRGDHQLLHRGHRKRPGPVARHAAHLRARSGRLGPAAAERGWPGDATPPCHATSRSGKPGKGGWVSECSGAADGRIARAAPTRVPQRSRPARPQRSPAWLRRGPWQDSG